MKNLYRLALTKLPRPLLIRLSYVFRLFTPIIYRGDKVACPVCGRSSSRFLSYGSDRALRQNVLCPHCLSLERHRLLWLYLNEKTDFFNKRLKVLHIAPEQCFYSKFRALPNIDYVTGDLESPLAEYHFDLHDIPFDAHTFDVVICNHVLEHVEDDRKCTREMFRVLKPGGWAIMQVPIDYSRADTLEDPSIKSPKDREQYYWQKDHMRLFGRDYPERLAESGFDVRPDDFVKHLGSELRERYRLQDEEIVYYMVKG
jgi:SAM-dependent methyltransferase